MLPRRAELAGQVQGPRAPCAASRPSTASSKRAESVAVHATQAAARAMGMPVPECCAPCHGASAPGTHRSSRLRGDTFAWWVTHESAPCISRRLGAMARRVWCVPLSGSADGHARHLDAGDLVVSLRRGAGAILGGRRLERSHRPRLVRAHFARKCAARDVAKREPGGDHHRLPSRWRCAPAHALLWAGEPGALALRRGLREQARAPLEARRSRARSRAPDGGPAARRGAASARRSPRRMAVLRDRWASRRARFTSESAGTGINDCAMDRARTISSRDPGKLGQRQPP